jgi:hypothetical protein
MARDQKMLAHTVEKKVTEGWKNKKERKNWKEQRIWKRGSIWQEWRRKLGIIRDAIKEETIKKTVVEVEEEGGRKEAVDKRVEEES